LFRTYDLDALLIPALWVYLAYVVRVRVEKSCAFIFQHINISSRVWTAWNLSTECFFCSKGL